MAVERLVSADERTAAEIYQRLAEVLNDYDDNVPLVLLIGVLELLKMECTGGFE